MVRLPPDGLSLRDAMELLYSGADAVLLRQLKEMRPADLKNNPSLIRAVASGIYLLAKQRHLEVVGYLSGDVAARPIDIALLVEAIPDPDFRTLKVATGAVFVGVRVCPISCSDDAAERPLVTAKSEPPDRFRGTTTSVRKRTVTKAALKSWYDKRIENWPAETEPPSRDQDLADAKAHFTTLHVTRAMVRPLRKLAPETWTRPGPNYAKTKI